MEVKLYTKKVYCCNDCPYLVQGYCGELGRKIYCSTDVDIDSSCPLPDMEMIATIEKDNV